LATLHLPCSYTRLAHSAGSIMQSSTVAFVVMNVCTKTTPIYQLCVEIHQWNQAGKTNVHVSVSILMLL